MPLDRDDELDGLEEGAEVIAEGKRIAAEGIPYLLDGIIPAYGMLGMLVAYAKVGKTTFAQQMAAAIAMERPFLGRTTEQRRVLVLAAEDPPEYTAYLARALDVSPGRLTFRRSPLQLDKDTLDRIATTVERGRYGLVLIASWQSVVRTLIEHENDNAAAVRVVDNIKEIIRGTGVAWLIDAHSGKGESQSQEADPTMALRGASAAAGSADYLLSLRYARGPFASERRLSGKGRFVNFSPLHLTMDPTGLYRLTGGQAASLLIGEEGEVQEGEEGGKVWERLGVGRSTYYRAKQRLRKGGNEPVPGVAHETAPNHPRNK